MVESTDDDVVGYEACGVKAMEFAGTTSNVVFHSLNHGQTLSNNFPVFYSLLSRQLT